MTETEIALARSYLARAGQDPIAALIASVRDLARLSRRAAGPARLDAVARPTPSALPRAPRLAGLPGRA